VTAARRFGRFAGLARFASFASFASFAPFALLVALVAGCGSSGAADDSTVVAATPLALAKVPFENGADPLGKVAATLDFDGGAVVFSDLGAVVLTAGVVSATDPSVKAWQAGAAANVPAPDGSGSWLVGVDGAGHVQRLRARAALEDVTDRWALADVPVRSVAALGGARVAFGFAGGFAVADGAHVTRYAEPAMERLVGGGGRVAAVDGGAVSVFDAAAGTLTSYALPGVTAIAIADDGTLLACTARAIYMERQRGALEPVYQSPDLDLHAATASGGRFWVGLGGELVVLSRDRGWLPMRSVGAGLSSTTSLAAGASGSVWAITAGTPTKLSIAGDASGGDGADQQDWQATIAPVFGRTCSACHLPGGSAGYDLSTYASWVALAPQIQKRVVVVGDMPPKGTTLSSSDRATITAWLAKHGQ
jgi:mono/diheme cytochrome c family protein